MGCGGSLNKSGHVQVGTVDGRLAPDQAQGQAVGSTVPAGTQEQGGAGSSTVRQGTPIVVEDVKEGSNASSVVQAPSPGQGQATGVAAPTPMTGGGPATCSNPACNKPVSGTSAYCSLECMEGPEQAPTPAKIDPKKDAVVFRDPRSQFGNSIGVIGFYYPDREEDCDKICGAGFLGNFWETPERIRVSAREPGPLATDCEHQFRNAEAAFQALKFWAFARDFEALTGDEAFLLKRQNKGLEDFTYGGKGDNWKGMLAVLESKFAPKSAMAEAILKTGETFLLEHNSVRGRDDTWSDNSDGEGKNWLGMQLMLIRDKLAGTHEWTDFITGLVSVETGAPLDYLKGKKWQDAVRSATKALIVKVEELRPTVPCSRVGCGKPSWNNQPGGYCSKDCRKTICQKYGCGKPSWNGKTYEYCSHACRQADNIYWTSPSYGTSYGTTGGISSSSYGTSGGTHNTHSGSGSQGMSGSTHNTHGVGSHGVMGGASTAHGGSYGVTGSSPQRPQQPQQPGAAHGSNLGAPGTSAFGGSGPTTAYDTAGATTASSYMCKTPGCGKPTWNAKPHEYCSKTCMEDTLAKAGRGPAVGGGMVTGAHVATNPTGARQGMGGSGVGTTQQPAMPGAGPVQPAMPGAAPVEPMVPGQVAQPKQAAQPKKRWGIF